MGSKVLGSPPIQSLSPEADDVVRQAPHQTIAAPASSATDTFFMETGQNPRGHNDDDNPQCTITAGMVSTPAPLSVAPTLRASRSRPAAVAFSGPRWCDFSDSARLAAIALARRLLAYIFLSASARIASASTSPSPGTKTTAPMLEDKLA